MYIPVVNTHMTVHTTCIHASTLHYIIRQFHYIRSTCLDEIPTCCSYVRVDPSLSLISVVGDSSNAESVPDGDYMRHNGIQNAVEEKMKLTEMVV